MTDIESIFQELNYPSAGVLKKVLKQRDIPFENQQVEALVKGETVRQVQAPPYQFTGKIAASSLNSRLFVDLIDFTAAPSDGGKKVGLGPTKDRERYALVVQRVFDRKLWTSALTDKRPDTVAEAMKGILERIGAKVGSITSDLGAEFGEPFKRLMESEGITVHTKRKEDSNAIATVDRAIGALKKALARVARRRKTDDWADILAEVTRGQNAIPNSDYLEGKAPKEVEDDEAFRRKLREKNKEFQEQNREAATKRAEVLESAGQFRIMLDSGGRFKRGFKPKWSERVYQLGRVDGAFVYDNEGNEYLSKFTLPVSGNAEELPPTRLEQRGSVQTEDKRKRVLNDLAVQVRRWIGDRTVTLGQVGQFLSSRNFRNLALEARLNMKSPVAGFLRTFPDTFEVTTSNGASYAKVLRAAPAFEGARRLRIRR